MRHRHRPISHHPATTVGCRSMMRSLVRHRIRCSLVIIRRHILASHHHKISQHHNHSNSSQLNPLGMDFQHHQISSHKAIHRAILSHHSRAILSHHSRAIRSPHNKAIHSLRHMPRVRQTVHQELHMAHQLKSIIQALRLMAATILMCLVDLCSPAYNQLVILAVHRHHNNNQMVIPAQLRLLQLLVPLQVLQEELPVTPAGWVSACPLECKMQNFKCHCTHKQKNKNQQHAILLLSKLSNCQNIVFCTHTNYISIEDYSKEAEAAASAYNTPYNQGGPNAPGSSEMPPSYNNLPPSYDDAAKKKQ
ncbi:uncharacterized protein LOC108598491 isoform X2 [Drosophila busckii]|uniref:uncharacterized protein LOC108598491 isoform X2 n=1 Tax=Drosophila busckii TaxID=30019 RepID=UPI00143319CF|nr:uncharacterized protein LOC108598491 isoform X2 [Drosophila busckii]